MKNKNTTTSNSSRLMTSLSLCLFVLNNCFYSPADNLSSEPARFQERTHLASSAKEDIDALDNLIWLTHPYCRSLPGSEPGWGAEEGAASEPLPLPTPPEKPNCPYEAFFFCRPSTVRRKRYDSVPGSMMCARSVMRFSSALHKRGFGNTWIHSENGRSVVTISVARSARSAITWNRNSAPISASGTRMRRLINPRSIVRSRGGNQSVSCCFFGRVRKRWTYLDPSFLYISSPPVRRASQTCARLRPSLRATSSSSAFNRPGMRKERAVSFFILITLY
jgi:hypothetical protein